MKLKSEEEIAFNDLCKTKGINPYTKNRFTLKDIAILFEYKLSYARNWPRHGYHSPIPKRHLRQDGVRGHDIPQHRVNIIPHLY